MKRFLSPGVLAALACCAFVAVVYVTHDCDPLAFVIMGSRFTEGDPSGILGYDGQFAYYIARDPVGARPYLGSNPSYRYQRIVYPMLARFLALGQPALIPWTLLLINIVSISWGTELLGRMLRSHGLSAYLAALGDCLEVAVTPRVRRALELQYRDRASRGEIASQLDLAVEGVKTLLRRARSALRDCVERRLGK